eukprot:COSAG02_NODE_5990_length_3886_cov_2.401109_3_plen_179_part_00
MYSTQLVNRARARMRTKVRASGWLGVPRRRAPRALVARALFVISEGRIHHCVGHPLALHTHNGQTDRQTEREKERQRDRDRQTDREQRRRGCAMPPKRQAAAEGAGSPAPAPTVAEPEPAEEELQPEPAAAPAATAEEGTPEPSLVSPSGAAGGQYGPIMRRRLKKFLAIVEADEGWE